MEPKRKLILKNDRGEVRGVLTVLLGEAAEAFSESNFRPIALLAEEEILPVTGEKLPPLPSNLRSLSLLGKNGEETLFATTLTGEAASMAKWRLCKRNTETEQEGKVPTSPLEAEPFREEVNPPLKESEERTGNGFVTPSEEQREDPDALSKARALLKKGEPFPLFDELMPGARFAKIESEECLCLIGIVAEGGKERVLYGVAGTINCPPDEDRLWTYFPTNDEEGFYLTEGETEKSED